MNCGIFGPQHAVTYHAERRSFVNDRILSVLEDIAINLERIAEALEALADK